MLRVPRIPKFPAQSPESTFRVYVGLFSRPTLSIANCTTPGGPAGPKGGLLWGAGGWRLDGHPQACVTTLAIACADMHHHVGWSQKGREVGSWAGDHSPQTINSYTLRNVKILNSILVFAKVREQNKVDLTTTFICNSFIFRHLLSGSSFILLSWCHRPMTG